MLKGRVHHCKMKPVEHFYLHWQGFGSFDRLIGCSSNSYCFCVLLATFEFFETDYCKASNEPFLDFLIGVKLSLGFCEEWFVMNNRGSREKWCWWVGSSCIIYLSGIVDEKDERAYIDPYDTIFNTPLENSLTHSPFPGAHLPLLDVP